MATGKAAIGSIVSALEKAYPDATYALTWKTPWELLVGSILAAQSTDVAINKLTPGLFEKYKDVRAFAKADPEKLGEECRSAGMGPSKAKAIVECAKQIVARFGGEVPRTMDEMITLPRVQRKTANVVLNTAFKSAEGIIVDLHVARVAPRLGLSAEEAPEKIERDLMAVVPKSAWHWFGAAMILHGRDVCRPSKPKCAQCVLESSCAKVLGGVVPDDGSEPKPKKEKSAKTESPARPEATASAAVTARPAKSSKGTSMKIPGSWAETLGAELEKPYFKDLEKFVAGERAKNEVFPPEDEVFTALELCPYDKVKVVLIGQDPYHDNGQAHGLCFSVKKGIKPPPSLVNMYKELNTDLKIPIPATGFLEPWAKQGILMINAVLTVRAHEPNSHKDKGWEQFTDAVIRAVNDRRDPVVFALWGGYAQKKGKIVDEKKHTVLKNAHPSPLSVKLFMGSKPFSAINSALKKAGKTPIDWSL